MHKGDFPELMNLIIGVFHQDWSLVFDEWRTCLEYYVLKGGNPVGNKRLLNEITRMLGNLSNAEIEFFFRANQAQIDPPFDADMTYREWLQEVQRMIFEDLARRAENN